MHAIRASFRPRSVLALAFSSIAIFSSAQTYTFTTIAGTVGTSGSLDGTNFSAQFNFPAGITLDQAGTLYVADLLNHTIRQLSPWGTNWHVTTLAGLAPVAGSSDGSNRIARFDHPMGIAVDANGSVFVADKYNNCVRKLTLSGTNCAVVTIAGTAGVMASDDGLNTNAHFWGVSGVAVDNSGHLVVVDSSNHTIRTITPEDANWRTTTIAGTALNFGFDDGPNDFASFDYPYSIAVHPSGLMFVTDWGNNAIRQIERRGNDYFTSTIAGFSGAVGTNDGPASTASFSSPTGIAVDAQTNIFVTDYGSHTIRKLSPSSSGWIVSTIGGAPLRFGSSNGTGSAARFFRPWGIVVSPEGELYIADYRNQTIRKGTPSNLPPPRLWISFDGSALLVSWPASAVNFVLESSPSLGPGALWSPITDGIFVQGPRLVYSNSVPAASTFYRLNQQSSTF